MTSPCFPLHAGVKCNGVDQGLMARAELLRHCLDLHKDLLSLEKQLHDYLDGLRLQASQAAN